MSRNYKKEYDKFHSSSAAKKKRAELNRINHSKGTYGNGDGLDVSHVSGGVKLEAESKNRGRKEKSRMNGSTRKYKSGGYAEYNPGDETYSRSSSKTKNKRYKRAGRMAENIKSNPLLRQDITDVVKELNRANKSVYNEKEQIAKSRKVGISKAKEQVRKEKETYNKRVSSGQRDKDRENAKAESRRKIEEAKKQMARNKGVRDRKKAGTSVTVDDLPIKSVSEKQRLKSKGKTKIYSKTYDKEGNLVSRNGKKVDTESKSIEKLDPTGTSGETEKQYQARLKKEKQKKLSADIIKPLDIKKSKDKGLKLEKVKTKKVKEASKADKYVAKMEKKGKFGKVRKSFFSKVKDKVKSSLAEAKADRDAMRERRASNKKAYDDKKAASKETKRIAKVKKSGVRFDPVTGKEVNKPGTKTYKAKEERLAKGRKKDREARKVEIAKLKAERDAKMRKKYGLKYQDGGMLQGPSHKDGGIAAKVGKQPIEMEGGEFVIKKSSAKKLGEDVLHYLNETGKVPQFMAGGYVNQLFEKGGMIEGGNKLEDNRTGLTPVYKHGGQVTISSECGAGDVSNVHTHSGYKAGE